MSLFKPLAQFIARWEDELSVFSCGAVNIGEFVALSGNADVRICDRELFVCRRAELSFSGTSRTGSLKHGAKFPASISISIRERWPNCPIRSKFSNNLVECFPIGWLFFVGLFMIILVLRKTVGIFILVLERNK